jgi:hypothetical protein
MLVSPQTASRKQARASAYKQRSLGTSDAQTRWLYPLPASPNQPKAKRAQSLKVHPPPFHLSTPHSVPLLPTALFIPSAHHCPLPLPARNLAFSLPPCPARSAQSLHWNSQMLAMVTKLLRRQFPKILLFSPTYRTRRAVHCVADEANIVFITTSRWMSTGMAPRVMVWIAGGEAGQPSGAECSGGQFPSKLWVLHRGMSWSRAPARDWRHGPPWPSSSGSLTLNLGLRYRAPDSTNKLSSVAHPS